MSPQLEEFKAKLLGGVIPFSIFFLLQGLFSLPYSSVWRRIHYIEACAEFYATRCATPSGDLPRNGELCQAWAACQQQFQAAIWLEAFWTAATETWAAWFLRVLVVVVIVSHGWALAGERWGEKVAGRGLGVFVGGIVLMYLKVWLWG